MATHPAERIRAQVEQVNWLREMKLKRVKDLGAYLAEAIRKDFATPAGFESRADRDRRDTAERAVLDREAEARQAKARARESEDRIKAYWAGLTPEEQGRLEAGALEQADPDVRANCETGPPAVRRMTLVAVREAHIRSLLGLPSPESQEGA